MRELPEPDIQPKEALDMGLEELPYFADKSVLAIQKQAYEDGLRDAIPDVDALAQQIRWANGSGKCGAGTLAEKLIEFLTASQKEPK